MRKRIRKRLLSLLLVAVMVLPTLQFLPALLVNAMNQEDYTKYVDVFNATQVDYGQNSPAAAVPYGLVRLSPDTYPHKTDDHAGYDYQKTRISGFSHTRFEGVGGQGTGGDILVSPTYIAFTERPEIMSHNASSSTESARALYYSNEEGSPGYYAVELTPNTGKDKDYTSNEEIGKIKAEMTADTRTGYHRYTFPKAGQASLTIDLNYAYDARNMSRNAIMDIEQSADKTAITGRFSGRNVSGNGRYTLYYYIETSKPAAAIKTWQDTELTDALYQTGNDIGSVLTFDCAAGEEVELKVSLSTISAEQAKVDMYNEIPDWDFDAVRSAAKEEWQDVLSHIKVTNSNQSDPDGELIGLFYTHLYRMFSAPFNATSTSGTFRGTDGNVYIAEGYTHYDGWALWDDFRKYPVIGMVMPDVYKDIIRSIANMMEYGISTWGHDNQTVPTVRTEHAVTLLADGIAKGFTDIENLESAYETALNIANGVVTAENEQRGYVPNRMDRTVEYGYDDWAISTIASHLGKEDDYERYLKRSFNYTNLYRENVVQTDYAPEGSFGLLWGKTSSGSWQTNITDAERYYNSGDTLYQGSVWQFTLWGSNDVNGLSELMGGKEQMASALRYFFAYPDPDTGSRMLYSGTNEIDLQTPYYFNFVGEPYNTQYMLRKIYTQETYSRYGDREFSSPRYRKKYQTGPAGLMETMDDDAGTMAAMFVCAAVGLFPMSPGDSAYQIGSPFFDEVVFDIGGENTFVIKANDTSAENMYIQSAELNGKSFDRSWIDFSEISRGGMLEFDMGNSPDSGWAVDGVLAPSSSDYVDTSLYSDDPIAYSTLTFQEAEANDGSIGNSIFITVNGSTFAGNIGDDLAASGKITVNGLPDGLNAKAVVRSDAEVELMLEGNAANHMSNDGKNLVIELSADTFTTSVSSKFFDKTAKILFDDYRLDYSDDILEEADENDGTLYGTIDIQISGGAEFTGNNGEDFADTGKVIFTNLPAGLTPRIIKENNTTVKLSFEGKAEIHEYKIDNMIIAFTDNAFAGDVLASQVDNSSRGGLNALILDFIDMDAREKLCLLVEEAENTGREKYTGYSTYGLLIAAQTARIHLENEDASRRQLHDAYCILKNSFDELEVTGFRKLEAEEYDTWIKDVDPDAKIKTESNKDQDGNSLINLGETRDGYWIGYKSLNFGKAAITGLKVRYAGNSGRCAEDARIEIRQGAPDGELLETVMLPHTANNWSTYKILTEEFSNPISLRGKNDIYFVMRGTMTSSLEFAGNIDWFEFTEDNIYGVYEAEDFERWSGGTLKAENTEISNTETIGNIGGSYSGGWLAYYDMNFGGEGLEEIAVRYASNISSCGDNGRIEVRLDSLDSEPVAVVPLPITASSGWKAYEVSYAVLETPIIGKHDVYLTMLADNRQYVANFDWFSFTEYASEVDKSELQKLYDDASLYYELKSQYTTSSFAKFEAAMNSAEEVLNAAGVRKSEVDLAIHNLQKAIEELVLRSGYGKFEAEEYDKWNHGSGGELKVEGADGGQVLANVTPNAWIKYEDLNFVGNGMDKVTVRYVNHSGRCGSNSRIELRLDAPDGELAGTIMLPVTGDNWNAYAALKTELDVPVKGEHDLYLIFLSEADSSHPYVGNFNWFMFEESEKNPVDLSGLQELYDANTEKLENQNVYTPSTFKVFREAMEQAQAIITSGSARQEEVEAALVMLKKAAEGLREIHESYGKFEAEDYDTCQSGEGGTLKPETGDGGDATIGNIYPGAWLMFEHIDFDGNGLGTVSARYIHNSGRCGENARIEIRLDAPDGELAGMIELPDGQSNWNSDNWATAAQELEKAVEGVHDIYFVFQADTSSRGEYVCNINWFYLEEAKDKEEPEVNKDLLRAAITYANAQNTDTLNGIVKAAFEKALKEAIRTEADETASQAEVNAATKGLVSIIHMLSFTSDPKELEELVVLAKAIKDNLHLYKEEGKQEFLNALNKAEEVLADPSSLDKDYQDAWNTLNSTMEALKFKDVFDTAQLAFLIEWGEEIEEDLGNYLNVNQEEFKKALDKARDVIINAQEQKEIDDTAEELFNAILKLRMKPDKTKLEGLSKQAEEIDPALYTPDSYTKLQRALTEAAAVLKDDQATEEQVKQAETALQKALEELVPIEEEKVNKEELEKLLDKGKAVDSSKYTADSYDVLAKAIKVGQYIMDDDNAVQEQVAAAAAAIKTAIAGLKLKSGDPNPGSPGSDGGSKGDNGGKGNKDNKDDMSGSAGKTSSGKVKTGDSGSILIYFILMAIASTGTAVAFRKRMRK